MNIIKAYKAVTHGSCVDILRKAGEKVNLTIGRKARRSTVSEREQSVELPPPMPGKIESDVKTPQDLMGMAVFKL